MVVKEVVKEGKRQQKTEVLSMRMDPKTRFFLDIVARARRQSISVAVEQALQDAADNIQTSGGRTWQDYWHVQEGIRSLKMWSEQHLFPTYEEEYKLEFTKIHWPFFYGSSECKSYLDWSIEVLWPKLDEFLSIWSKTKSSNDYFAAGEAMQQALREARLKPPDWPIKPKDAKEPATSGAHRTGGGGGPSWDQPKNGGPSWDAPKGGDLDDEIPF